MQREKEEEKKEGKHRGGLFQAEVVSLQGLCTCIESNRGGQNSGWPVSDVQHTIEEHKHRIPTYTYINAHNICKCTPDITRTSSALLTGGSLVSGDKIHFACWNIYEDKTLEDSTECLVRKRISLFLWVFFSLPSRFCWLVFFSRLPLLSVCSFSFSLTFSCPSLPLGTVWLVRPVIELPLFDQGGNRNCTLLTQLCRYVCVCECKHIFQEGALIVCGYVYNVWLSAACVCLITVCISLQSPWRLSI